MTERCVGVKEGNYYSSLRLNMLDENPDNMFLYVDTSIAQKTVSVFVYDPILKEFIYKIENAIVIDSSKIDSNKDVNYNADSWIDIEVDIDCSLAKYANDQYKIFVLNTTEYPIDSSSCDIILDYDNKETYITYMGE